MCYIVIGPCLLRQPRCTWVIALPDSTRRLCLATKKFSSKRRKLGYFVLYMPLLGPLGVRAILSWRENKIFLKKKSWKKIIEKKYFWKKLFLFFERKILRVESGRAITHVHRGWRRELGCSSNNNQWIREQKMRLIFVESLGDYRRHRG